MSRMCLHRPYPHPYHRSLTGVDGRRVHYVSSGSVGKPKDGDPRACWVEIVFGSEADVRSATNDQVAGPCGTTDTWLGVITHRVAYDIGAVATAMSDAGLPATLSEALRTA